ncbi:ATP-dependent Clp protease ATP-binding subunit ClpA [Helicobacter heilmannii]|uniref:AAA family ATPase n=1 Tax=Helicobacter heilmannii TaxID=35817 RepID=UPI0006A1AD01|nr:AAA family ATPase [Helicobacter heilmannii]CRF48543.1 ATP-dependent Clp protease ATP-binding subunit ClpA [Helicobacter heilmannii]
MPPITTRLNRLLNAAMALASKLSHRYITPEHLFFIMLNDKEVQGFLRHLDLDIEEAKQLIQNHLTENIPTYENALEGHGKTPVNDEHLNRLFQTLSRYAKEMPHKVLDVQDLLWLMVEKIPCYATEILKTYGVDGPKILEQPPLTFSKEKTPALKKFARDLNALASKHAIDPVSHREVEIQKVIEVLGRRKKNNPLLVGEPGVGKTAIAEGLALKIANQEVPSFLLGRTIYALDLSAMVAGSKYRGEFEKRLKKTLKELQRDKGSILFIDEIHTVLGAGASSAGALDGANILKPMLADGSLSCIGATTFDEFRAVLEKDKAFCRRFSKIDILEPSKEDCYGILEDISSYYEHHHKVKYSKEALKACVDLSVHYLHENFLPDKAIDLMDMAGSFKKIYAPSNHPPTISKNDIENVLSFKIDIPKAHISPEKKNHLKGLEDQLKKEVFAQDEAITRLVETIKIHASGLAGTRKPVASFLFVGPSGVGKTELAKVLAKHLHLHLERFDMSEYKEPHSVSKLIGAPSGYVGFEQGGLLVNAIRKHPRCVLLLDEIEKAHPNVYDLLLQITDDATLTDNTGRKSDFRHAILILTSNAGSQTLGKLGFLEDSTHKYHNALKEILSPELRSRLDAILTFKPLDLTHLECVVQKECKKMETMLAPRNISLVVDKSAINHLASLCLKDPLGARMIEKLVHQHIKVKLSDMLLFGGLKEGGSAKFTWRNQEMQLTLKNASKSRKLHQTTKTP